MFVCFLFFSSRKNVLTSAAAYMASCEFYVSSGFTARLYKTSVKNILCL